MFKLLGVSLVMCALAGCATATVNHPIDTSQLSQFKPGIATEADVEAVLGQPMRRVFNSQDNHTALLYGYTHVSGSQIFSSAKVDSQGVVFVFDASGRMMYYRTNNGSSNVH